MPHSILALYGFDKEACDVQPFGSGLINNTWVVTYEQREYILQRINTNVFKKPQDIAYNVRLISEYLTKNYPDYLFVVPEKTLAGEDMVYDEQKGYFRMMPFVKNSHTVDVVATTQEAFEASAQFGQFTKLLSGFDATQLRLPLVDFHNLSLRYQQFLDALEKGNKDRIAECADSIEFLKNNKSINDVFENILKDSSFKLRVTHHDTKISNVLFDDNNKGLCVIDLDTVMPGYFISDVGDMMRTYLSPVSEEETDFSKINVREEYFKAIVDGYSSQMGEELSANELKHFVYAGKFMIYMQALRFITDYLNNDVYYGARYEKHNFNRGNNQIALLKGLLAKEDQLNKIVDSLVAKKQHA